MSVSVVVVDEYQSETYMQNKRNHRFKTSASTVLGNLTTTDKLDHSAELLDCHRNILFESWVFETPNYGL